MRNDFYVYALHDPARDVFYIGKGCGDRMAKSMIERGCTIGHKVWESMTEPESLEAEHNLLEWARSEGINLLNQRESGLYMTSDEASEFAKAYRPNAKRAMRKEAKRRRKDPVVRSRQDEGSRKFLERKKAASVGLGIHYHRVGMTEVLAWESGLQP